MTTHPAIKGSFKSVTMYAAFIIALLSNLAPYTDAALAIAGLDAETIRKVGTFIAIIMAMCRTITTTSLAEKGSPDLLPPPVSQQTQGTQVNEQIISIPLPPGSSKP